MASPNTSIPGTAGYYLKRGNKRKNRLNFLGALNDYTKAINLNPNNPTFYYNRAVVFLEIEDFVSYNRDLQKEAELLKDKAKYHMVTAWIKKDENDYHGVLEHLELSVQADPSYKDNFGYLLPKEAAEANIELSQYLTIHNKIIETDSYNFNSWYRLSQIYFKLFDFKNIDICLKKCLASKPENTDILFLYSKNLHSMERYHDAIFHITKLIRLSPDNISAISSRAFYFRCIGDFDKASQDYSLLIEKAPASVGAYISRAYLLFEHRDFIRVIQDCTSALELMKPSNSNNHNTDSLHHWPFNCYILRGQSKHEIGNYHDAITDYDCAIAIHPTDEKPYKHRALAKIALNDLQSAMCNFRLMIRHACWKHEGYILRANFKMQLKNYQGALADYKRAVRTDPYNIEAFKGIRNAKKYLAKKNSR
jgi:tetratricopeptide (TPR) repeat protein